MGQDNLESKAFSRFSLIEIENVFENPFTLIYYAYIKAGNQIFVQ